MNKRLNLHNGPLDLRTVETPAYVFDLEKVEAVAATLNRLARLNNAKLLYAVKACNIPNVLEALSDYVDGYSCSSLLEIQTALKTADRDRQMAWISPLLLDSESVYVFESCSTVVFNSLGQLQKYVNSSAQHGNVGLRVNPEISFLQDSRYDPCSPSSRLGVRRADLERFAERYGNALASVRGLHFHNNCDSTDSEQLYTSVYELVSRFGPWFQNICWVNIGGGYLPTHWKSTEGFSKAIRAITNYWDCQVFFEPGADFVRDAGFLVATVEDLIERPGYTVAVLDTTVNHWPEVFEFQFAPDLMGESNNGHHKYILTGRSCLTGDVFGEYCLDEPLALGCRIMFTGAGAYSVVKAHNFNGLPSPNIYCVDGGEIIEIRGGGED